MKENEAKALFMAQYLGQRVFGHPDYTNTMTGSQNIQLGPVRMLDIGIIYSNYKTKGWLELRTVDQLTDDEYLLIAKINFPKGKLKNEMHIDFGKELIRQNRISLKIGDYLRAIGILLPFTFLDETNTPVTYSTSALIERGWVRIKEKKK